MAVHGYSHWSRPASARLGLPQKLVAAVREHVPKGDVVFSDPDTAYELGAFAPVYVNAAPQFHVANTPREPSEEAGGRRTEVFFPTAGCCPCRAATGRTGSSSTAPACIYQRFALPRVYSGSRYVLYRLR